MVKRPAKRPAPVPAPPAWGRLLAIAAVAIAVLMAFSARDGYHRDELYFLQCAKHMAWGFVDQPPFSIALAWLSKHVFGTSLAGLRLFPALADGGAVLLTGLIAAELGGARFAQSLAALAIAGSPFLIAGHLAGPTIYDMVAWAGVSLLVLRILRTGNDRLWLAVGAVVGVALLDKETILLLLFGIAVGLVATGRGRVLVSPWLAVGALIALALWSPTLVWQAQHRWPMREMSANLRREHSGIGYSVTFLPIQLLLPGWYVAPVWIAGLVALWRDRRLAPYRAFAVAFAVLFVLNDVFLGDRPYYVAPLYMVLLAAGGLVAQDVVAGARRFLSTRPPRRRRVWRSERAALTFVAVLAVIGLPLSLPVLPATALADVPLQNVNYNLGETIGWPDLVSTVARVYRSLPPAERARTAIVTGNYGEAGAVARYGRAFGLPAAYSGHNNEWLWGPPSPAKGTTIAVGFWDPRVLAPYFSSVTLAARIHNRGGVENDEEGAPLWICRGQRAPWPRIWPAFRHYG